MRIAVLFIFVLFSTPLFSNPLIELTVEPNTIGTNETAEIRVNVINETAKETPYPSSNSDDFDITYRGFISQRQFSIINGAATSRTINTYSFIFTPKTSGNFTIPTFVVTTEQGNQVYSPSTTINVQAISNTRPQGFSGFGSANNPFGSFFGAPFDAFVTLDVKQSRITQNTGVLVNLYLYSNDPNFLANAGNIQIARSEQFKGGTIYNIPIDNNNDVVTEQFGVTTYYGKLVQTYLIFALDTGRLSLYPPVLYEPRIQQNIVGDPIEINSVPITDSLSYIGNNLSISHSLSTATANISDEITLNLSIEGDGNVDFFTDPLGTISISNIFIDSPSSSLEVEYDTEESSYARMRKIFSYTIIAKESGQVSLPEIKLNFFTSTGQMTNIVYPSIMFDILESQNTLSRSTNFNTIQSSSSPFRYYSGIWITISALIISFLLMICSMIYAKEQKLLSDDPIYARSTRAKSRLKKLLLDSEQAINDKQYKNATRLIRQSVLYFCADKFGISNSSSPQEIINYLQSQQIEFTAQQGFLQLMNDLDFHAFGTPPTEIQVKGYINEAYHILEELDKIKIKSI